MRGYRQDVRGRTLLLLCALVLAATTAAVLLTRSGEAPPLAVAAPQDAPGTVLLVPGYGGATTVLEALAQSLRAEGREAAVVSLPGNGTGDLRESAEALDAAADAARGGTGSVDVIGYSAGGLVARLWAREHADEVRRVVTLGSPHHGTGLASLGAAYDPGSCPAACLQMVPGSDLLEDLNRDDETPDGADWLSLWTTQDSVVTPPDSARREGAVNVVLQDLCPGLEVDHGGLPLAPVVRSLVVQALSSDELVAPAACPTT